MEQCDLKRFFCVISLFCFFYFERNYYRSAYKIDVEPESENSTNLPNHNLFMLYTIPCHVLRCIMPHYMLLVYNAFFLFHPFYIIQF